ncbi:TPA: hypothetical protein NIA45_006751 [Pseudomonas aeruginosa]|nr:hypothetical protein [Pseudomonas aeruginosa]
MTAFMNRHADLLGLETAAAPKKALKRSQPIVKWMVSTCLALGLAGGLWGTYADYREAERVELARQEALRKAQEQEKNRELRAKLDAIHSRAQRHQYQLDSVRKGLLRDIENMEKHRDSMPRVNQFFQDYPLPESVRVEIGNPVDFTKAVGDDTFELQVQGVQDPQNVEKERQRIEEVLNVVRRYRDGFNDSVDYFNGEVSVIGVNDAFVREFGRPDAKPRAMTEPKVEQAPVVESQAPASEEPVAETKAVQEPKPAARPAAPTKPRTVPAANGGVQVTDW